MSEFWLGVYYGLAKQEESDKKAMANTEPVHSCPKKIAPIGWRVRFGYHCAFLEREIKAGYGTGTVQNYTVLCEVKFCPWCGVKL